MGPWSGVTNTLFLFSSSQGFHALGVWGTCCVGLLLHKTKTDGQTQPGVLVCGRGAPMDIFFTRPCPRNVPNARPQFPGPMAPWRRQSGMGHKGRAGRLWTRGGDCTRCVGALAELDPPPTPDLFAWFHSSTGSVPEAGRRCHTSIPQPHVLVQGPL